MKPFDAKKSIKITVPLKGHRLEYFIQDAVVPLINAQYVDRTKFIKMESPDKFYLILIEFKTRTALDEFLPTFQSSGWIKSGFEDQDFYDHWTGSEIL